MWGGGCHVGGAGGVLLLPSVHDGGRGGGGEHRALRQRDVRVKSGEDTCNMVTWSHGHMGCLSASRTMGVIPTIENLYQIIFIVPGTPGCRHQTPTTVGLLFGRERGRIVRQMVQ